MACASVTNVSANTTMCFGSITPRNEAKLLCEVLNTSQNRVSQCSGVSGLEVRNVWQAGS
jgi:hypothetical protein